MKIIYFLFPIFVIHNMLFAYQNFHGCCLAPDSLTGWVVTLDSIIVLKTTDGGAHWFEQTNPAAGRKFFDVTCRSNLKVWTCGILGEITHSSDGGQTWVHQVQGLAKYATRLDFIDDTLGWAVCGDGVVGRTTDGGGYWEQIFTPFGLIELYGVSFVNHLQGWAVSGWPDSVDIGQGLIIHSSDGGFNWDSLYRSNAYEDFFDVHFFDESTGIIIGGDESNYAPIIWKTTDGGNSWAQISAPSNAYYLRALDFADNLNGWAVGRFGTIIHTSDGGNTWISQTSTATGTLFDVDFSDPLHGIACGYDIILYTTNGGMNWNIGQIPGIEENARALHSKNIIIQAYPNPFSDKINIRYTIPYNQKSEVSLKIYDVSGRLVKTFYPASIIQHQVSSIVWAGDDDLGRKLPSGVYFISLDVDDNIQVEKAILMR